MSAPDACIVAKVASGQPTQMANARLLRAAPALLEAATAGLRAMRSLGWDVADDRGPSAQLRRAFEQANAILTSLET